MSRIEDTEVILSTHSADASEQVGTVFNRSPSYRDTEVTGTERTVIFRNGTTISDTSVGKERRFKCRIRVTGNGIDTLGEWEDHQYVSPLTGFPLVVELPVDVPDFGLPSYDFDVFTEWVWERKTGDSYSGFAADDVGPEEATVNDHRSGG